jgi:hypothetical protein
MYLVIGYETDPCCQIVSALLRHNCHEVYTMAEPLAGDTCFCWTFDTTSSQSSLRWRDERLITDIALRGVWVRGRSEPIRSDGWEPGDLAYIREETQSALIAWLQSLPCPVINRFTADLWFQPQRPLVEWRNIFMQCGLPTLAVQITNDPAAARCFADHWQGELMYSPLTSSTRYRVATAQQWSQLAQLMEHLPVALLEPYQGTVCYASIAGSEVIWSPNPPLSIAERKAVEVGLHRLTHVLQIDLVQVELLVGNGGPRCVGIHLFPQFAVHSLQEQYALGGAIVALLTGNSETEVQA